MNHRLEAWIYDLNKVIIYNGFKKNKFNINMPIQIFHSNDYSVPITINKKEYSIVDAYEENRIYVFQHLTIHHIMINTTIEEL